MTKATALLGWSLPAIEAAQKLGKPFVVVSFADFETYAKEHNIPFVAWDFNRNDAGHNASHLVELLNTHNAGVGVALFEETVGWAGEVNAIYRDDLRLAQRMQLFRNKMLMKRRAQLVGLRVGLFEEVDNIDNVRRFMTRLNRTQLNLPDEPDAWVHLKPFEAMGTVGHKLLKSFEDIDKRVVDADFPCIVESHLPGQEFSTEVFIHGGEIKFLNITEYVRLGYSNFIPASSLLEQHRPTIEKSVERLIKGFGIEYGIIHPEWFIGEDGEISFGEVANRIPGGHMFELMEDAYGFSAYQLLFLASNPETTEAEFEALLPASEQDFETYAGCLMVYPNRPGQITQLQVPTELTEEPFFDHHTLTEPLPHKVGSDREGYGNHYGTIFFKGDDAERMRNLLVHYQGVDFYV
ncbi:MAG: ATP-grasp domain-containing protein [Deinococcota bacterium]